MRHGTCIHTFICNSRAIHMNFHPSRSTRAGIVVAALLAAAAMPAQALEFTAGDYEQLPGGMNIGLLYLQHADRTHLYANGNKIANNFKLTSDVALLRYIRTIQLNDTTTFDANLIVPMARLRTSGAASVLGDASGVGDIVTGGAFKFLLDPTSRDVFSIAPFLTLPTGQYNRADPLSIGENRWKLLVQMVYIKHFGSDWALDLGADATHFGNNTHVGPSSATMKTKMRFETQAHLRYNVSPATTLSVGIGHISGAENKIAGISSNDEQSTTYGRLTAAHFIDKTTQLQVQLGRDLSTHNGPAERIRVNFRLMKLF